MEEVFSSAGERQAWAWFDAQRRKIRCWNCWTLSSPSEISGPALLTVLHTGPFRALFIVFSQWWAAYCMWMLLYPQLLYPFYLYLVQRCLGTVPRPGKRLRGVTGIRRFLNMLHHGKNSYSLLSTYHMLCILHSWSHLFLTTNFWVMVTLSATFC